MTTRLADVFSLDLLYEMEGAGYVRRQRHPTYPYEILNYTEKAAYESVWNDVTRQCRGLIYDTSTGEVIARPFPKFFNYGQAGAPVMPLDAYAIVTDKMDGSLGILYPDPTQPTGYAVATRGSFTSEQAVHATALFNDRYAGFTPDHGWTMLFEIIYPENRIVVDYEGLDDLVFLGAVEIETGDSHGAYASRGWPGPVTKTFPYTSLAEALAAPPRAGREGFVVWFPYTDTRIKIKYDEYVKLHRIVTGLNARTVWEYLVEHYPSTALTDLITPLPDEFHAWVNGVAAGILDSVSDEYARLVDAYDKILGTLAWSVDPFTRDDRKAFAIAADPANNSDAWAMFALLDGRDIRPELLKRARPEGNVTPSGKTYGEDTA